MTTGNFTYEQLTAQARWLANNPHKRIDYHMKKRAAFEKSCACYINFANKKDGHIRDEITRRIAEIKSIAS